MPLRTPNNPTPDVTLLTLLAPILTGYPAANTKAGINSYPVIIQDEALLPSGVEGFPVIFLRAEPQDYHRIGPRLVLGSMAVDVEYLDRWDLQSSRIDQIRANFDADLELMKSNVESNPMLAQNNNAYTIDCYDFRLSPYNDTWRDINGIRFVHRVLSLKFWLLPYDV